MSGWTRQVRPPSHRRARAIAQDATRSIPPSTPPSLEERKASRARVRDLLLAPPDAPVAVTVARLHPQKGVDVWLDAASILVARGADLHLAWIGQLSDDGTEVLPVAHAGAGAGDGRRG